MDRYTRQMTLPEIGEAGQKKLAVAKILIVGAGGLGSPSALYLAGAGVGTIGIVDSDNVELVNLHRQILHRQKSIGMPKADSAKLTLGEFNSEVQVNAHNERLNAKNVQNIIKNYDIVIDAVDNFEARYVINEACVKLKRPMVSGAVLKYQGQLSVFNCSNSPCYSCVYPVPPPEDVAPKGSVAGILGMIPGVIGTMQALEAVKLITGLGEPLVRKLLIFDGLTGRMRTLEVKRDLKCRVCGAGN